VVLSPALTESGPVGVQLNWSELSDTVETFSATVPLFVIRRICCADCPFSTVPKESDVVAFGQAIFVRRQGPHDFSCATCHADAGKRSATAIGPNRRQV
jgi:hypothetical protein